MSRQPYQWTPDQLKSAERMWENGVPKRAIAEQIDVSYDCLQFHLECGELCHLKKRKIGSGRKPLRPDDESKGILFGLSDWKERAKAVRDSWGDDESYKRRHGHT